MQYSEIKSHIKEWKRLGLEKIPRMDIWEKRFWLGTNRDGENLWAKCAFNSTEMLRNRLQLPEMIQWHYERFCNQARQLR